MLAGRWRTDVEYNTVGTKQPRQPSRLTDAAPLCNSDFLLFHPCLYAIDSFVCKKACIWQYGVLRRVHMKRNDSAEMQVHGKACLVPSSGHVRTDEVPWRIRGFR